MSQPSSLSSWVKQCHLGTYYGTKRADVLSFVTKQCTRTIARIKAEPYRTSIRRPPTRPADSFEEAKEEWARKPKTTSAPKYLKPVTVSKSILSSISS